jgi:hypothetical protein
MDLEEIKETDTWLLYDKGLNYLRMHNVLSDTDVNYRMYNGNQWEGVILDGVEPVQYNFIETIVNYKVSTINSNLWAINYSSENFENRDLLNEAENVCKMLNKKAANVWEKDQMDYKIRQTSDDAAINDEGVIYVTYDESEQSPVNEVINKQNVMYGNENSSDIQSQPYILISQRLPVSQAQEVARQHGAKESDLKYIVGDNITFDEAGLDAKQEVDDMCTLVTKMWKDKGTVWYSQATRYVDIIEDTDTKLRLYPLAHFVWNEKKGWSRGEGEVRGLKANQLELNKTIMRTLLSVKNCAYPQKIANMDKIQNPSAVSQIGGVIKTKNGATVDDVRNIFGYVQPTSMSTDVTKVTNDLIGITRELKNAAEIATGGINPEQASGKAILAVQQASQQPLVKQLTGLKRFIEDLARIWMDMWNVYTPDGMQLEEDAKDMQTGEDYTQLYKVPSTLLEKLKTRVKVDITPKGAFDRYARELTLENFAKAGFFTPQRVNELRYYAEALPDDAAAPKQDLLNICEKIMEDQQKIAMINAQAQIMQQNANQFINATPEDQATAIGNAMEGTTGM